MIAEAFKYLEFNYKNLGLDVKKHANLDKLLNNAAYKAEVIAKVKDVYKKSYVAFGK